MPDTYTDDIERAPRYRCACKYPDCPQCNPEPEEADMPDQPVTLTQDQIDVVKEIIAGHMVQFGHDGGDMEDSICFDLDAMRAPEADEATVPASEYARLVKALADIEAYGEKNTGHGYTCAQMAKNAVPF